MIKLEGIIMKHPYQPQIPIMTIYATSDELIVIGTAMTQHLNWIERTADKTREQLELMAILRSLQGRLVSHGQNQPMIPATD
jgi:hypothetical protein